MTSMKSWNKGQQIMTTDYDNSINWDIYVPNAHKSTNIDEKNYDANV